MIFVYAALLVLSLIGLKVSFRHTDRYLSMDSTNTVRGIYIMLIFLSHFMQYYTYTEPIDKMGGNISKMFGQMIVVMFMFYSGYGIGEAYKRKGHAYIKSFPKHRILKTFVHFEIAILLYFVLSLILHSGYSAKRVLLSFIGWESIGNSNWYIFAVIILYILTWVAFSIARKDKIYAAVLVTAFTFVYIVIIANFRDKWWFDTALCYPAGLWYSFLKDKFEKLLARNNVVWFVLLLMSAVVWWWSHFYRGDSISRIVEALVFVLFSVLVTLKFTPCNKLLAWLGKHTFEIYILMRMPMKLLELCGLKEYNLYLYFFASLAATVLLSALFSKMLNGFDKLVFRAKKA